MIGCLLKLFGVSFSNPCWLKGYELWNMHHKGMNIWGDIFCLVYRKEELHPCLNIGTEFLVGRHSKQVDVLPSKNQALCDLIYNVIING